MTNVDEQAPIVVVDDDRPNVLLLRQMLERAGYENLVATTDPAEAIGFCTEATALLLVDLHMPGTDGYQVMAAVLERLPALAVIVLTGDVAAETTERALAAGAAGVLVKPFDYDELLRLVAEQLERR